MTSKSLKFFWACDYNNSSGEGKLARLFIEYNEQMYNYKFYRIKIPKNLFLNHKYILPILGIIYCWLYYFKKKDVYYVNYLPFWNILLFIFMPPRTKFGPITGGAAIANNKSNYIRKNIFPILYKISEFFIDIRNHYLFSTELLKKNLSKKIIKKSKFNFVFKIIGRKKLIQKKNIDFLIYNRNHPNKKSLELKKIIKKLILYDFDVRVIGDRINFNKIKNYGYISNYKVKKLLEKTYFTFLSEENTYSIFILECIENNVKILVGNKILKNIKYFKNSFCEFNSNKIIEINNLKEKK